MKRLFPLIGLGILLAGLFVYSGFRTEQTGPAEPSGVGSGSPEPPLSLATLQELRERVAYQAGPTTEGRGSSLLGISAGGSNVRPPEIHRGWAQGSTPPAGNAPAYP